MTRESAIDEKFVIEMNCMYIFYAGKLPTTKYHNEDKHNFNKISDINAARKEGCNKADRDSFVLHGVSQYK